MSTTLSGIMITEEMVEHVAAHLPNALRIGTPCDCEVCGMVGPRLVEMYRENEALKKTCREAALDLTDYTWHFSIAKVTDTLRDAGQRR